MKEYKVMHFFSGIGGAALGFQDAAEEFRGLTGHFRTLGGIDCDPAICEDFEQLTGAPAAQLDLFTRDDYTAFHGHEPGPDWNEVTPLDIFKASGNEYPDVVFLSPPCKGFSGLLPSERAASEKYQALNRLVVRGLELMLNAYAEDLPGVVMIENVPRITTRGEWLLKQVKHLLGRYGYVFHEGYHDCGEVGGLGQHRRRYLLIARHKTKLKQFIYNPAKRKVKSIGNVLERLPLPDDPIAGPLHRLPRLKWKTWVRLALIPAGGDWRDLPKGGEYGIAYEPRKGAYQVAEWEKPSSTVIGSASARGSNGVASVADPRLADREGRHPAVYRVVNWEDPANCVTGTRFGSGAPAVSDPRISDNPNRYTNKFAVEDWNGPAGCVTGIPDIQAGAPSVGDPRIPFNNVYRVCDWGETAGAVTSGTGPSSSGVCVADPRLNLNAGAHENICRVEPWGETAHTVTGATRPAGGGLSVADPRLGCKPRSGTMGVQSWNEPGSTVIGAGDIHASAAAVADPRIPKDNESPDPPPIIISLDGTWHRPLTTLELAALQGFPLFMRDGSPLNLAGKADAKWRERIGNAVPPPAAKAIAEQILCALLANESGREEFRLSGTGIWVKGRQLPKKFAGHLVG